MVTEWDIRTLWLGHLKCVDSITSEWLIEDRTGYLNERSWKDFAVYIFMP